MTDISTLELKFKVAQLHGKSMSMEFFMDDQTLETYQHLDDGIFVWSCQFSFPSTIGIKLSNKNPHDTELDKDGNIIADKYIKLLDIVVDRLPCAKYYVNKAQLITDQGKQITSDYWGFNGYVKLDFTQANSFLWSVSTQNKVSA